MAQTPAGPSLGSKTVEFIRERLQVDREWSVEREGGFTWWAHTQAQHVWAEAPVDDDGVAVTRIHVRTDLIDGFSGTGAQLRGIQEAMRLATLSGPIRDGSRVSLASSVFVHEGNAEWAGPLVAWAAAIQLHEAHFLGGEAAKLLGTTAATTAHPTSGPRMAPDGILGLLKRVVLPKGEQASRYVGEEIEAAVRELQNPPCVLCTGDSGGLSAEFPLLERTSLLRVLTGTPHPLLGNGALWLLALGREGSVEHALDLNGRELKDFTRSHFLGSWCPGEGGLTFAGFLPNALHRRGLLLNLALSQVMRAKWVAEQVMGDDWSKSFEKAQAAKLAVLQALAGDAPPEPKRPLRRERKAEEPPIDAAAAAPESTPVKAKPSADPLAALLDRHGTTLVGDLMRAAVRARESGKVEEATRLFQHARDTFGKSSPEWKTLDAVAQGGSPESGTPTTKDPQGYVAELAESVAGATTQRLSLKARALLNGFGYHRRTSANAARIRRALKTKGLATDFGLDAPRSLDDEVCVYAAAAAPAAHPASAPPAGPASAAVPLKPAEDAIASAVAATVHVLTDTGEGSGFVVSASGLVVTARHVVEKDGLSLRKVKVRLFPECPNEQVVDAVVFRSHPKLDFALLWLAGGGSLPTMAMGDPRQLRYAETVYAIGCPAGMPGTVSRGIVSNPLSRYKGLECIQSDAAIDHGNSGGPLVTERGEAVGITLWGIGNFDAAKFCVPIDYLTEDVTEALRHGREACLEAPYCPFCGHTHYSGITWYCRNCGIQLQTQGSQEEER